MAGFFASRRALTIAALACIAIMLVAVNLIAAQFGAVRVDLTRDRLYTLSRGTRATLAKIDEPITLRLYYSTKLGDALPSYAVYQRRVRELLDQYVAASGGKLRLETYDPLPFSDVEDRAVALGLQGAPLDTGGEQVYFGVAGTNSTDDRQVIPFFASERERFLEYDLTKLVHSLAVPKKTIVGLMTALPLEGDMMAAMRGGSAQPTAIVEQLRQLYRLETVPPSSEAIPPDVDVLMLVHPQNLTDRTLFAIDQFVLKGGKALVFVDPYSELQGANQPPPRANSDGRPEDSSSLSRLFQRWGLQMAPNVVAGDADNARRVGVPAPGRGTRTLDYIAWLNLGRDVLNRDDPITADLDHVAMATAGILEPVSTVGTKFEPLITTSENSEKIPVENVTGLPDVATLLSGFHSEGKRYTLAARVTGVVDSAFPDGPPQASGKPAEGQDKAPAPAEFVKRSAGPINVVAVADSDMLDDRFWAQSRDYFGKQVIVPNANNGDFVANAIDVLAGGADLIDLRSRGTAARPFILIDNLQRDADTRYALEQQRLEGKLKETQAKLHDLTGKGSANPSAPPAADQSKAIEQFRADLLTTRQQLRAVQGALRQDIERLKAVLEFFDIALIPLLVMAAALALGLWRRRRHLRRQPAFA
jgi:ABC-type uncharacterized transport system involved in gliding motility auxiliary subunit